MSEIGECKECGAKITRSTTFCRSCNAVFPGFVELSKDTSASEKDKATAEKKRPRGSELTYSPIGSPQEQESNKPDLSPSSASESISASNQTPTDNREPKPGPPDEPTQETKTEPNTQPEPEPKPEVKPVSEPPDPTRTAEKKDRPTKSTTGEFAVFQYPKLPQFPSKISLSESGEKFFSSAEVIAEITSQTGRSPEEVAGVVDGFWDYIADVRQHYKEGPKHHFLIIPHFGTFRFRFKWKKGILHRKLTFMSSTTASAKAHRRTYSSKWADQWSDDLEGLSVRRKISVYISERCGLPLLQSDMIFNRLLRTARELCEGGGRIHWARRGTMGAFQVVDKKDRSTINPQSRENITVRTGRDSITGERIPAEGNEHFSFCASKGFLKRLNLPAPPKEPESNRFSTSSQTGKQLNKAGCHGCFVTFSILISASLGWIIFLAFNSNDFEMETEYDSNSAKDSVDYSPFADRRAILKAHAIKSWNPSYPKSSSSHEKTRISFSNELAVPVIVHWVDFEGTRKKFFEVKPQREIITNTYARHIWLITDSDGKALMYFSARKVGNERPGLALITRNSISTD